jgi:hypothetical protein
MKKILFILGLSLILFNGCVSTKQVSVNDDFPKSFDEAEQWFDKHHKTPLISSTDSTFVILQSKN